MVVNHISLPSAQVQCSRCNTVNRAGVILCENCGTTLIPSATPTVGETQVMDGAINAVSDAKALEMGRGNDFRQGMTLRLTTVDGDAINLMPKYGGFVNMGRSDPAQKHQPELDLTEVGGYSKGISRSHAALVLLNHRLKLMDMNSSNGTYLNDERIAPRQFVELRHGDTIRLGTLEMQVTFSA